ncbi:MAG: bifunctional phosphoglucose/phosphomannose isomerase [Candidatus Zixiibacteriota bacterium]
MSILNDVDKIRSIDPENMYNRVFDFPEHIAEALQIGKRWKLDISAFTDVRNVVVIGMGGSAIGGDLVRSYLNSALMVPFQICRNYSLPEFVDDETLVIASSYSGNTEETLSALDDAIARKAMIAAISTGGMLEEVCKLNDIPMAAIPGGMQPRAALAYSFVPLLVFLEQVGLIKGVKSELSKLSDLIGKHREQLSEDVPLETNGAKTLATQLHGKIPIIYGGPTLTDVIAVRWKGQICENAKNLSFANQFPEFNHNELVGWSETIEPFKQYLCVVMLRDGNDHPKVARRIDIVKGLIERLGVDVIEVRSGGVGVLERLCQLIQLGDFMSYYLAVLNQVDPSPVHVIQELKAALIEKTPA